MRTHGPPWGCRLVGHQFADDVRCGLGLRCDLRCLCRFLATTAGFFGLLAESVCVIARDGADRADRKFKPPARARALRVTGRESTPGPEADCPRAVSPAARMRQGSGPAGSAAHRAATAPTGAAAARAAPRRPAAPRPRQCAARHRRAEAAPLAAERDEPLGVALLTAHAQEALLQPAALQVATRRSTPFRGGRRPEARPRPARRRRPAAAR